MTRFSIHLSLALLLLCFVSSGAVWQRLSTPSASQDLKTLTPHPLQPNKLFVASDSQIFEASETKTESFDALSSTSWKKLWHTQGVSEKINRILLFPSRPDSLFVLTQAGLFQGNLSSHEWKEVFQGKNASERHILSFTLFPDDPDHWLLGTAAGLFESDNAGNTWFPFDGFSSTPIYSLFVTDNYLFVATTDQIYRSHNFSFFEPVLTIESSQETEVSETNENTFMDEASELPPPFFSQITGSTAQEKTLWVSSAQGVFMSHDLGRTWEKLSNSGLQSSNILRLAYSPTTGKLFGGTDQGVYLYHFQSKRWEELFQGLDFRQTQDLEIISGNKPRLLALTPSGLHTYPLLPDQISSPQTWLLAPDRMELFRKLSSLEPSASEIQNRVIQYNHVANKKIDGWHRQSRLKSFLPSFSFGHDFSRGNSIDLDRGSTSEPDQYILGPDDLSEGWDFDVSWDLADLIWSSAQTSIDSREKLMIELRSDLLAQATRLYYERRRLQMEIAFAPAETEQLHWERLIRLDELTSHLDSLTGGYFGESLQNLYAHHPELQDLWRYVPQDQEFKSF